MKRKFVSALTGLLLCAIVPMQAFAADASVTDITVSEAGTQTATVTYSQDSTFTVTIPKEVTLPTAKTATYNVNVKGDIKNSEKVTVEPDTTVTMADANGKESIDITVTQTKTDFTATAINTAEGDSTTGSIDGTALTAGSWTGVLSFEISKVAATDAGGSDVTADGITLTSDNLATYGIATTGDVVIPATVTTDAGQKNVVKLGKSVFKDCTGITSVTIQE